jgi:hypothetical protein
VTTQRLIVRLEDNPLRAAVEALLDEQGQAADGHVLILIGQQVGAAQGARAPDDAADDGEAAQAVDAQRVEHAVLLVGQHQLQPLRAVEGHVDASRRFPHAALGVGAGVGPGNQAGGRRRLDHAQQRVGGADAGK